ncbi:hypothetical protein F0L68_34640 [Solihabitans fulvus]|uniref:Macro domain-containing protein n=1 Tax=Solihabitans fulvus TaxID=1892852 RepID=A0A5B2WPB2_9PSEU|nr:P-loop NTPase fold protein [Solihabitans fulvus]KAA2252660.1 hypothetical protein F0L68_34640 [Solihabitans fulvus]
MENSDSSANARSATHRARVSVEVNVRPWTLPIDAIVLSVGGALGNLGLVVREQFPQAQWQSVQLASITPDRPGTLLLRAREVPGSGPWLAVLTSPQDDDGVRSTFDTIVLATTNALRVAAEAGASAVGIPILGTGALGLSMSRVAAVAVPAAIEAADGLPLRHLAFLTTNKPDAETVTAALEGRLPLSDNQEPGDGNTRPFDLAGGVSGDWVDPNSGIPLDKDNLGVAPYVSMLATVIADRKTPTPLSVGIFGEWGSGKSYFMGLLRHQVAELTASSNLGYCANVAQIGFNAWHYSDANLWASLGDEIFRQLAGPEPNSEDRRRELRVKLTERLDQRAELEAATHQARTTAAELQAKVDAAVAAREARTGDLITALRKSPEVRRQLNSLWRSLGVHDQAEQAKLLAAQLHGTLTDVAALRRAPMDRAGRLTLEFAGFALVAGVVLAAFAPAFRSWLAGVTGALTVVFGVGTFVMARAQSGLRALRSLGEDLRSGTDRASRDRSLSDASVPLEALRQAEADQRVAEAQLSKVVSHVGELGRQLAELAPGRRLYRFLADRAAGDSYARNLGLISMIRKDFEQLIALLADQQKGADDGTAHGPIDRIVLYIDDLDRCEPEQVVEVLQAVHLLLALELFVVVIGVDPRWLLRSLCSHYEDIINEDPIVGRWHVTPADYLEKIINIPMVLPGMPQGSLRRLLRSIVDGDGTTSHDIPIPDRLTPEASSPGGHVDPGISVEAGSEVEAQLRRTMSSTPPQPLTEPELALLSALDVLIDTPREAKRLFNLYRMLRATRDLSEASQFLGNGDQPGEYEAVVVLLGLLTAHASLLEQVLYTRPDPAHNIAGGLMRRPSNTPWTQFVDDTEPRDGVNRVVGVVSEQFTRDWSRLHDGLAYGLTGVTLADLSVFQRWVPRIRRFSYALVSKDEPGERRSEDLGIADKPGPRY